jgi:hypothetical protein
VINFEPWELMKHGWYVTWDPAEQAVMLDAGVPCYRVVDDWHGLRRMAVPFWAVAAYFDEQCDKRTLQEIRQTLRHLLEDKEKRLARMAMIVATYTGEESVSGSDWQDRIFCAREALRYGVEPLEFWRTGPEEEGGCPAVHDDQDGAVRERERPAEKRDHVRPVLVPDHVDPRGGPNHGPDQGPEGQRGE